MKAGPAIAVLASLAAGCAPIYPIKPAAALAPAAIAPEPAAVQPAPIPQSPIPRPPARAKDQCGAADLQGLVGRPRSEIPVPLDPNRQRVACRGCPITEDYDPGRLNFFFDAESGLIREVRCG